MRCIVTGSSGFVGKHLVSRLKQEGHGVHSLRRQDGDVAKSETWQSLPVVDRVFHLAGRSFVPDSWADPADFLRTIVDGTREAAEYCRRNGAKLTFVSAYIYGIPSRLPIREDDPVAPNNPYAFSKYMAEEICRFYADNFNVPIAIIRPFNIYGPMQRGEFLIPELMGQINGLAEAIKVKDLKPRRDYVHVDDVVEALMLTDSLTHGFHVINVGTGISYSVGEIIDVIQSIAGTSLPVISVNQSRPNEIPDVRADISLAKKLLEWYPRVTFAEGVNQLVNRSSHD